MSFFLASLLLGIALEIPSLNMPVLMPLFWHMLMVGWITQIIFGVSIWMFPGRTREEGFQAQILGWLTYLLLNLGLILRIIAEPMLSYSPALLWNIVILVSAILQVAAAVTYVMEMWPRILSKKQQRQNHKRKRQRSASRKTNKS
ncbi:MAG TPA: hypothetical protein VJ964_04860 [Balneolaceae bacterium]|nr:hypothetical protein [Balneolaceae bacterium]